MARIANTTWFTFHKVHCNKIAKGARMRVHHTTALTSMRCCTEGTVRNQQLHQAPNSVWDKIFERHFPAALSEDCLALLGCLAGRSEWKPHTKIASVGQ